MSRVKVAVVQAGTTVFDAAGAVRLVDQWAERATAEGARLAVFPEAFVGGYPRHHLRCGGGKSHAGRREEYRRYFEASVEVPAGHRAAR